MILIEILWRYAAISALAFGGGIAATPLLERTSVAETGWVSSQDFATAIALSYMTPGPFMIVAAFVGYRAAGIPGALAGTVGVFFLPGLLAGAAAHTLRRYLQHPRMQGFSRGAGPAVVGLLLVTALSLLRASMSGWVAPCIAVSAVALLWWTRVPPFAVMVGGAVAGVVFGLLGVS